MVVWEKGRMKKSDYRKFIIRGEERAEALRIIDDARWQNDDFASMREAVARRYRRLQEEKKERPELMLSDGGIEQLHAVARALESLQIMNQPVASTATKAQSPYRLAQADHWVELERH